MAVSGKGARAKGLNYERAIANKLKPFFPDAKRHLESQKEECFGYDLDNTGPYKIQIKRLKKYASISKIFEVKTKEKDIPLLITKGDQLPEMVVMPLEHFLQLLGKINEKNSSLAPDAFDPCKLW